MYRRGSQQPSAESGIPGAHAGVPMGHPASAAWAQMNPERFRAEHLPLFLPQIRIRVADLLVGRSHTEAIEMAVALTRDTPGDVQIVLDGQDWLIERAIRLHSGTELIVDGCRLKMVDGICDNLIRSAGVEPDPACPFGLCLAVHPTKRVRITGVNGATVEGADHPYTAANPKTGLVEPWLGDFFGWRTICILLSNTHGYEVSGLTMRKTHCWAISQDRCSFGSLHDLHFETAVKNGDGIDFRNGCSYAVVERLTGTTSDDTVACTALAAGFGDDPQSRYVFPMQPLGYGGAEPDIHDIVIRDIRTGGSHHAVICLTTTPSVHDITIERVHEEAPSDREACVKIYTGYGHGYVSGNLRRIIVRDVIARGASCAVMIRAQVDELQIDGIPEVRSG